LVVVAVLSTPWLKHAAPWAVHRQGFVSSATPVAAVEFLLDERPPAPLFNENGFGSYLIWAASPAYKVFSDPRLELYDLQLWQEGGGSIHFRMPIYPPVDPNVLLADGIPACRLVVIRSGVDLDRFSRVPAADGLRDDLGIPRDHLVVGTVAAMARHKDYPTLLVAAQAVLQAGEKVTFCAVGDGPERGKVHALARRLGLGDRCMFVGFQDDVGPYLRLFDIFVMASRTEGLGTSLIDALAVGLPVAATRAGGIGEIVRDGENGLLVSVRNPTALAGAILRLIHDRDLRARLSAQARPSVEEFAITHTVRKNLELYQRLMQSECRGRPSRQRPECPAG
ncbi:MAG: glycosyltransferase family 4 protein, partial [Candidatus Eisenbacteria bacterium]|nr:glycosyltransferase family 4 protein [Candidatus Eisenbacteria bacterium]